jgi:hypothetical protein
MELNFETVAGAFGLDSAAVKPVLFESGHIHRTFLLVDKRKNKPLWVLQGLNKNVFKQPELIMDNWNRALNQINKMAADGLLVGFKLTANGRSIFTDNQGSCWRLMPFVVNSVSCEFLINTTKVFNAAFAFGRLSSILSGGDVYAYHECLPGFHDLTLRFHQFQTSVSLANKNRLHEAQGLILKARQYEWIVEQYSIICQQDEIPKIVVHGDCKPSNVLFGVNSDTVLAIADPDTLMPGYFFSDLGDMVRSMVCQAPEDELDEKCIVFRDDYFLAIVRGYLAGAGHLLQNKEKQLIGFAGKFMLYMQGLRFLTDYLSGDVYYPVKYHAHNLIRARNQLILLDYQSEHEHRLAQLIQSEM